MKHWHAMNGSVGCLPDNNEVHTSKRNAIDSLCGLFDGERGLRTGLRDSGIFYFSDPGMAGADYAEVTPCSDPDCSNEE